MSATFRIAKQKHSQNDLRRFMNEQKPKTQSTTAATKKIDSPLAKYNDLGQLICILCRTVVRSEDVWKIHINAKQHKQNIEEAKKLKQQTNNFTKVPFKRPADQPLSSNESHQPEKKLKSILKNSTTASPITTAITNVSKTNNTTNTNNQSTDVSSKSGKSSVPSDFFDVNNSDQSTKSNFFQNTLKKTTIRNELITINRETQQPNLNHPDSNNGESKMVIDENNAGDEVLPEGFFDDPIKDAKARNLEYKDPVEEEWDRFQKEIKAEADFSNAIMAEEQEEATVTRQIDEIDEQIRNWTRVLNLEKRKEDFVDSKQKQHQQPKEILKSKNINLNKIERDISEETSDDDDNDENNDNFDEYLDWRAKKSNIKSNK